MTLHGKYGAFWVYANKGRKRYSCPECGETFYYPGSRNLHTVNEDGSIFCPKVFCPKCKEFRIFIAGMCPKCGYEVEEA